ILSLIVSLAMVLSLGIPTVAASPADYTDLPDSSHFTYNGIVSAIENGIMQGVGGGIFAPNTVITRAEAAIYLVNVMGATVKASLAGATDINPDAWYVKDGRLAVAVQMGVISPVGGKLRPDDLVTREEAFDMMARAVKLTSRSWNLSRFEDRAEVSNTYAGSIQALVSAGYVNGIPSGDGFILSPKGTMTRGEFATLFGNVFQGFVSGAVSSVKSGNVVVKKAGTVLKNLTVKGDLIIGDGVGNGDVTLDNVKVEGRLVVRGGGKNSIIIINGSSVGEVVVARVDGAVRVSVSDDSSVQVIYVDDGKNDVIIQGDVERVVIETSDVTVTLQGGTVGSVTVSAADADVIIGAGAVVEQLNVRAEDVTIEIVSGAKVETLNVSSTADVTLEGTGKVGEITGAGSGNVDNELTGSTTSGGSSGGSSGGYAPTPPPVSPAPTPSPSPEPEPSPTPTPTPTPTPEPPTRLEVLQGADGVKLLIPNEAIASAKAYNGLDDKTSGNLVVSYNESGGYFEIKIGEGKTGEIELPSFQHSAVGQENTGLSYVMVIPGKDGATVNGVARSVNGSVEAVENVTAGVGDAVGGITFNDIDNAFNDIMRLNPPLDTTPYYFLGLHYDDNSVEIYKVTVHKEAFDEAP
ncbi:MAG: S-layer homology domain-containing protein, partial [Oscillospiraceae bacterium]|nr:S-layer homology domain-containing protein [Oscillospiraceae bacterium]